MELLIVYNAKKGLLHGALDWSHKLISPSTYSCNLCGITYGNLGMKKRWSDYLAQLQIPVKFWYKKDFKNYWSTVQNSTSPVNVPHIALQSESAYQILIDSKELQNLENLGDLILLLDKKLNSSLKIS